MSNSTANIATGPTMWDGATFHVYADPGKTSKITNWGNLNMQSSKAAIRIYDATYQSVSSNYQNLPGELEVNGARGKFVAEKATAPLKVWGGKIIFNIPRKGYNEIPCQVKGDLEWDTNAKIRVNVKDFVGTQTLLRAQSLSTNLGLDDFIVENDDCKKVTFTITPAVAATETEEAQPGTVEIDCKFLGTFIIFR